MNHSLILNVNLLGVLEGQKEHLTLQSYAVPVMHANHEIIISKEILHTDREPSACSRRLVIAGSIVTDWVNGECPHWEKSKDWKKFSESKRIYSYLKRYDEGYGFTVEELGDGDD